MPSLIFELFSRLLAPSYIPFVLLGVVALVHVVPYILDPHKFKGIPGPFLAKFSDAWLSRIAALGNRSGVVHELHQKYGKFVRIAPNHVSIADPDALQIIYAHGNGSLKSDFYDAFVSIHRGLFNTRDRTEHTRKRKIVSNIFSQKNVLEFEPYIRSTISGLLKQWDRLYESAVIKGLPQDEGVVAQNGRVWFDVLDWYNYLAFDIIGDLAFGTPFGMVEAGRDSAPVLALGDTPDKVQYLPAVQILNDRGDFSASLGVTPPWIRPYLKKVPWYAKGNQAVQNLAGIAVAAVSKRLSEPSDRNDLLSKLAQGKDCNGKPLGREELTAEALTQLIAGSDTTSNSSCAITYHLAMNPSAQKKLQQELDEALGPNSSSEDLLNAVATSDQVKALPYLEACINEGLRVHSTSSIGLPRIAPEGGLVVSGRFFPEGSILSVPSYTIHRDVNVWGKDPEAFRPERWFEGDQAAMQKTFNPFSWGPRACVGKNLATMELQLIIGTILKRYEFVPQSGAVLETREGFLRKPLSCVLGVKRRDV